MVKTSKKQIELDEKKVIERLQMNCMENLDLFAKNCGFSRQKVWRIIKNLEKENVVWGYTAIAFICEEETIYAVDETERSENKPANR